MAGLGSRFSEEGYTIPKPLISVSGIPMIIQVIRNMPPSDKWIFIVRQEHIKDHKIDEVIRSELPKAIIIAVNETTPGQASTCLLAQAFLEPNEPVFIAACDNSCVYDQKKYQELIDNEEVDCIVWTFTQMKKLQENPHKWGWTKLAEDRQTIIDISVKVPVSNNPFNDHAVVASFYFKRSKEFIEATNLMIKENHRINNEFYVDAVPIFMKRLNKKSVIFDVEQFICWGSPIELKEYEFWEKKIKENKDSNESSQNPEQYLFWKKYFKRENIL